MGLSNDLPSRAARLMFAALMALTWSGYVRAAPPGAAAGHATDVRRMYEAVAQTLQRLEEDRARLPRETFEIAALVRTVGRDPVRLFEWVRDQTTWVPYRGLLRGDRGVLMDHVGSALDRAVLLYALLRSADQPARLAHARLTQDQARQLYPLLKRPAAPGPASRPATRPRTDALAESYARRHRLDAGRVRADVAATSVPGRQLWEEMTRRTDEQARGLSIAIGHKPTPRDAPDAAADIDVLQDHWWVQRQVNDRWEDLDPLLPDAKPGQSVCPPQSTSAPDQLGDLGEENLHRVQLRVIVEFWERGGPRETTVLSQKLLPAALLGVPIVLTHSPMNWPKDLDLSRQKDPMGKLKEVTLQQHSWLPVLAVGDQKIKRYSFSDDCLVDDTALPTFGQSVMAGRKVVQGVEDGARGAGQGVGGILGGRGIGGAGVRRGGPQQPPADTGPKRELTAEWLEYEIDSPGREPQVIRRQIFDVLGPAARAAKESPKVDDLARLHRGLALLGATEILPLGCRLSPAFVQDLAIDALVKDRATMQRLTSADPARANSKLLEDAAKMQQPPGELYALAVARSDLGKFARDIYLDRPNVFTFHRYLQPNLLGQIFHCRAFDIVSNDVAVRREATGDPFLIRLWQGVFDTNAEALLMEGCGRSRNTAEVFTSAGRVQWLPVHAPADGNFDQLQLPRNVTARIKNDLAGGYQVVAPKTTVVVDDRTTAGWWRVDGTTGQTLGIGSRGWGEGAVEYFVIIATVPVMLEAMFCATENPNDGGVSFLCSIAFLACGTAICLIVLMLAGEVAPLALEVALSEGVEISWEISAAELAVALEALCHLIVGGQGVAHHMGGGEGGSEGRPPTQGPGGAPANSGSGSGTPTGDGGSGPRPRPPLPPLDDDPNLPGKIVPPWHDLG